MTFINRDALFCDETGTFRIPPEADAGDRVNLLLRTAKRDVDFVYYIEYQETDGRITESERSMQFSYGDDLFDYYRCELRAGDKPIRYFFRVEKQNDEEDDICYYTRMGVVQKPEKGEGAFCLTPGFHVPDWVRGAVMYQIYVDRFCNGDSSNDVETNEYIYIGKPTEKVENWSAAPADMDVRRFYGGDLQGVKEKLAYLKGLKVEAIYLNPVFVSPSNHKYDCQDYDHIDPHIAVIKKDSDRLLAAGAFDNKEADKYAVRTADKENLEASDLFFAKFVTAAHEVGIRVILDGVFNHCGSFNKWLDAERIYEKSGGYPAGAYQSAGSPYRHFFKFNDENAWPDNESYDGWWGHATLPKLNYEESPDLYQYILEVAKKWVSPPYNVDGWRLDVAADLGKTPEFNHRFWKDFRQAVKEANPNAVILAEHYGDASAWLKGDEWDTVMNYDAFMEPVSWFLTGLEKHSNLKDDSLFGNGQAFFASMKYHMSKMQTQSLFAAMNELSNHDHSRFMTRTNRTVGRLAESGAETASKGISYGIFRQGVVMLMTWPGAPTIYYGDETGVCGWTDPDNRRTYPWGSEQQELIEFHRYMTGIRARNLALRSGSIKQLVAESGVIAYGRFEEGSKCVIAVNTDLTARVLSIPVWQIGITDEDNMWRLMLTYEEGYNAGTVAYPVRDGCLEIEVPGRGTAVFGGPEKNA